MRCGCAFAARTAAGSRPTRNRTARWHASSSICRSLRPRLRAALFDLGQEQQRLLLISHHLVIDGVSWRILLEDLHVVYTALEEGRAVQLAPKTVSFKHWAAALMAYASSREAQGELAYWQSIPWSQAPRLARDHDGI